MNYKLNPSIQHQTGESYAYTVLRSRGITDIDAYINVTKDSLNPYQDLDNIEAAASVVIDSLNNHEKVFIQVDSDNDGITSAAIIYNYIKRYWPDADIAYRMHTGKQHGVIVDTVPADATLVIIPDAGSNQYEEQKELRELGKKVIILDHHQSDEYSEDAIIVNNHMSPNYLNKTLSGAGVVYKFCQCLDDMLHVSYADDYLDLAAVGIVGDMMDLDDLETRFIVSYGLSHIKNYGLQTIAEKLSFSIGSVITPTAVSFYITPLLNAIIRVGSQEDKETLFLAFIDGRREVPSTKRGAKPGDTEIAAEKAARVGTNAKNRQKKVVDECIAMLDDKIRKNELHLNQVILVTLDEAEANKIDSNITGLVAMKLMHQYGKPVLVVREGNDGIYKGSARGDGNSELAEFKRFIGDSQLFEFAEGHQGAFGVGIDPENIERFIEYSNQQLAGIDLSDSMYLADFEFEQDDFDTLKEVIFDLDPLKTVWGKGVDEPKLAIKELQFTSDQVSIMGASNNSVKISVGGISFVKFKDSDFADEVSKYDFGCITILGNGQLNEWNGSVTPQVVIRDYEIKDDRASF